MTPDEVRMLDNRYALLFIRGERPIMDEKFDIMKHPNIKLSADGEGKPYIHGQVTEATGTVSLVDGSDVNTNEADDRTAYLLLSDERYMMIRDLSIICSQTLKRKKNLILI